MMESRAIETREKQAAAGSSVAAGILLSGLKLTVGIMTGSLGILAEAAHSALDLGAALLTYFAVRTSAKPPDEEHHYGHQRIENLAALGETALLLLTCGWIISEAVKRLTAPNVQVDVTWYAFVIMAISIGVDWSRSRALLKAARRYDSQALEADALHFSTDMASALVVILGLALVALGRRFGGGEWFEDADAFAALAVALIVIVLSVKLGKESFDALMDKVPAGLRQSIEQAALDVAGVLQCRDVRIRRAGADRFVDLVIVAHGAASVEESHRIADQVERRIQSELPRTDVMVHVEPAGFWADTPSAVRGLAARYGFAIHDLAIHEGLDGVDVDLHLEVPAGLNLQRAHELAAPFEEAIRKQIPSPVRVNLHLDPEEAATMEGAEDEEARERIREFLEKETAEVAELQGVHDLKVLRLGRMLYVSLHGVFDGDASMELVHGITESMEARLRRNFPDILRVLVQAEPAGAGDCGR